MTEATTLGSRTPATAPGTTGRGQLLRFLLVGGSNTLVTLALFVALQHWLPASVA